MPDSNTNTPFPAIVALAIGTTRARLAHTEGEALVHPVSYPVEDVRNIVARVRDAIHDAHARAVVIAGVNPPALDAIERALRDDGVEHLYVLGRDLPIPIRHALRDASTVGHDRLVCALGAFAHARQACIVIDAGTAITTDFVDGEGTFMGGAIAPGVRMCLRALHEGTRTLPLIEEITEPAHTFGGDTPEAMLLGVLSICRGGVHRLIERYALRYGAYPQIVATGGDAPLLFEQDPTIEHIVPDLQLMGIVEAARQALDDKGER